MCCQKRPTSQTIPGGEAWKWGASEPERGSWNSPGVPVFRLSLSPGPFLTVTHSARTSSRGTVPQQFPEPFHSAGVEFTPATATCFILPGHHRKHTTKQRLLHQERWWVVGRSRVNPKLCCLRQGVDHLLTCLSSIAAPRSQLCPQQS